MQGLEGEKGSWGEGAPCLCPLTSEMPMGHQEGTALVDPARNAGLELSSILPGTEEVSEGEVIPGDRLQSGREGQGLKEPWRCPHLQGLQRRLEQEQEDRSEREWCPQDPEQACLAVHCKAQFGHKHKSLSDTGQREPRRYFGGQSLQG